MSRNSKHNEVITTYHAWVSMRQRCRNPKSKAYRWYGAVGIKVCERWEIFENFLEDMGPKPKGLSIDRIDNNKGYFPGNCRWATMKIQSRNKTTSHLLTHNGKTQNLVDWTEELGLPVGLLNTRLLNGWGTEDALLTPVQHRGDSMITYNEQTKNITEWAKEIGIKAVTLKFRIRRGWSVERAIETPSGKYRKTEKDNDPVQPITKQAENSFGTATSTP